MGFKAVHVYQAFLTADHALSSDAMGNRTTT